MILCTNALGILLIKAHRYSINVSTKYRVNVSTHLKDRVNQVNQDSKQSKPSKPRPPLLAEGEREVLDV